MLDEMPHIRHEENVTSLATMLMWWAQQHEQRAQLPPAQTVILVQLPSADAPMLFQIGAKSPTQAWYIQQRSNQSTILIGHIASECRKASREPPAVADKRPLAERLGFSLLPAPDFLLPRQEGMLRSIAVHNGQVFRQACDWDHPLAAERRSHCLCCCYRLHSGCRTLHDEDVRCDPGYTRELVEKSLAITAIYTDDSDLPHKGKVTAVKASWGCGDQQPMPYPKLTQQLLVFILIRKWHSPPPGPLLQHPARLEHHPYPSEHHSISVGSSTLQSLMRVKH